MSTVTHELREPLVKRDDSTPIEANDVDTSKMVEGNTDCQYASEDDTIQRRFNPKDDDMMALDRQHNARKLKWIFCSASLFTITVTIALIIDAVANPRRHLHGAVSSDHPQCSQIGLQTLKDGGSAVDSAIATLICLGVVNMQYSGIGG